MGFLIKESSAIYRRWAIVKEIKNIEAVPWIIERGGYLKIVDGCVYNKQREIVATIQYYPTFVLTGD